jgi:predicted metal-binding membrane protein
LYESKEQEIPTMDEQESICCADSMEYQGPHQTSQRRAFSDVINLPRQARNPISWMVILLLAALAWIPTLQQALSMLSIHVPMIGPMGMSLGIFLLFWTIMMIAMMFPALAPTVSVQFETLRQQTSGATACFSLLLFLVGYTLIWTLFGLPTFFLSLLDEHFFLLNPILGMGLDIALLVGIGLYQMTPFEKRCLSYCNPTLGCHMEMSSSNSTFYHMKTGLIHGIHCLGTCGGLMLVMVVGGFMNLPWMVLLTLVIFVEKTWSSGDRLSFLMGIGLILIAMLAFIDPSVLSSFYL